MCGFLFLAPVAQAELQIDPNFYNKLEASVEEVVPRAAELYSDYLVSPTASFESVDLQELDWDQVILIGEKIIEIVKAGESVVDIRRDTVAAVPAGITDWRQLAGWQVPSTKVYAFVVKNGWGMKVVDVRLKISAMWGGNFEGKGAYLSNVLIVPTQVKVIWGFNLNIWSENREPVNTGSVENPVAGLGFDIRYQLVGKVPLNNISMTQDYFIHGTGQINMVE